MSSWLAEAPEPVPLTPARAQPASQVSWTASATYIGAERCKLCHRSIYQSWTATAHAREAPLSNERREEAAPPCADCHVTVPDGPARVECESCHGPGSDYWPAEVLIDPEKAAMAGLVRPGEAVCRRCHDGDARIPGHDSRVLPAPAEWCRSVHVLGEP